jgi:hydroxymethylpyrimidine/phosphomethylpyrimidine kinase
MMKFCSPAPIALTIAGSDPSGGAGIQADLKTFAALGVYGASVITALTAQNTTGVSGVLVVPPAFITAEIDAVATDLAIGAVKTGMLGDTATLAAVVEGVRRHKLVPLVVDPVMVATSGDVLLAPDAVEAVRRDLVPLASVITPNLHEAARLLATSVATDEDEMREQGRRLLALGPGAVLMKGGHRPDQDAVDLLVTAGRVERYARPWIDTRHTHGTGCTLSAAIAAGLAEGHALAEAVRLAKDYLWNALAAGRTLGVGRGRGPVDHGYALRIKT